MKHSLRHHSILIITFFLINTCIAKDDDWRKPSRNWCSITMSYQIPSSSQSRELTVQEQNRAMMNQDRQEMLDKIHNRAAPQKPSSSRSSTSSKGPSPEYANQLKRMESYSESTFNNYIIDHINPTASYSNSYETFVLNNYDLYQYDPFLEIARKLPDWEDRITELYNKLTHDSDFAESTREFDGYYDAWGEGFGKVFGIKSRFHKLIEREYQRLQDAKKVTEKCYREIAQALNPNAPISTEDYYQHCSQLLNTFESITPLSAQSAHVHDFVELGKECARTALVLHHDESDCYTQRSSTRAQAIYESLRDNKTVHHETYDIDPNAASYAQLHNLPLSFLTTCRGNAFQQTINKELISTLEESSPLFNYTQPYTYVDSLTHHLMVSIKSASEINAYGKTRHAMALSDYTDAISKVGLQFIEFLQTGGELAQQLGRGTIHGIIDGGVAYGADWAHLIAHPTSAVTSYIDSIKMAGWAFSKVVDALYSPDQRKKIFVLAENIWTLAKKNPEQAAQQVSSFITQAIICKKVDPTVFAKGGALFSRIQKEIEPLKKLTEQNEKIKKLAAPLTTVVEKAHKTLGTLERYKNITLNEFEKLTQKLPKFLRKEHIYQEFSELKQKSPHATDYNYVHIFHGELELKDNAIRLRKGLHTKKGCEEFIKQSKIPRERFHFEELPNGVTRVNLPTEAFHTEKLGEKCYEILSNGEKIFNIKTLWPKNYTQEKILEEAAKIISNPKNQCPNKMNVFIGRTSDNIRAKVCMDNYGNIATAYPTWEQ